MMSVPSFETGSRVSASTGSTARTSSVTSSPVTAATFIVMPRSRASRAIMRAQLPARAPPALVTNFVPRCAIAGSSTSSRPARLSQ
jgi:hypothetical protein